MVSLGETFGFLMPENCKPMDKKVKMTHLSDKDHKAQMEDMACFDEQMPCVGIFWYERC